MEFERIDRSNTYAVKWEERSSRFGTEDLLPLWVADMDLASPVCVQEALKQRAAHPIYGYTIYPPRYYSSITGWMQKRFSWEIEKEWIVPAYGVVPSIHFSIEAYTQPGDGVIVQTPVYPPFIASVHKHRRVFLENRLRNVEGRYYMDFDDLERKAAEAKLLLLCSPHNPVGRVWEREELERVAEICERHEVTIVADEIHADIVYARQHTPMPQIAPSRTVLLGAPSKTFNIAGLNTSFAIIGEKRLRKAYLNAQRKAGLSDGNPFGIEALIAAYESGEGWLEALKAYLEKNINYVNEFIANHKLAIIPSKTEATFLIWLDCRALGLEDKELQRFFVEEAKLGLNAGVSFGEAGSGFMRINIATSLEVVKEAMERLLHAYRKRSFDEVSV